MPSPSSTKPPYPLPENEAQRLDELHSLQLLDTLPEAAFDDLAAVAATVCGTPVALVSLVDRDRQWFKAQVGTTLGQTPREQSICAHAIVDPERVMVVPDTTQDPRFADNPLVTGEPRIRFYVGAPIVTDTGAALGTVCAVDVTPRELTPQQQLALQALARQASRLLLLRRMSLEQEAREEAESATRRERLHQITAASTHSLDLQSFIDRHYFYRYVNDRYLEYWATTRDRIEGHRMAELIGEDLFKNRVKPMIDKAFAGERIMYEALIHYPGRGPRHARVTFQPAYDDLGEVFGVVMRVEDVDELMTAQDELRRTVDLLERRTQEQQRFIHMISHDLREPLNTICNFSALVQEDYGPQLGEQGRRWLGFVAQGSDRMRTLLDGLLEHVRLEGQPLRRRPIQLGALVDAVLADLASAIEREGASVTVRPLPQVDADPTLMRVLLQNLISNAIKFHASGQRPEVEVFDDSRDGQWRIAVRDHGIGIDEAQQARLFVLFKRLRSRRDFEGTGLGLATCRRIAELHGGQIELQSEAGVGSTFTLCLPQKPGEA